MKGYFAFVQSYPRISRLLQGNASQSAGVSRNADQHEDHEKNAACDGTVQVLLLQRSLDPEWAQRLHRPRATELVLELIAFTILSLPLTWVVAGLSVNNCKR